MRITVANMIWRMFLTFLLALILSGCAEYRLYKAAGRGDAAMVHSLVESGTDVNCSVSDNLTPLHYAAIQGHADIVSYLCERNADVNAKTKHGCTPLYFAAENGNAEVVRVLLAKGADTTAASDDWDETPICRAAYLKHPAVVEMLLDAGSPVDPVNVKGYTPLMLAAEQGAADIVRLLLAHNADLAAVSNEWEEMAIHRAAYLGHSDVVEILLDAGSPVDSKNVKGSTPLSLAAEKGFCEIVNMLLAHNASVSSTTKEWYETPLHRAAYRGHLAVVRALAEAGAPLYARNKKGNTARQLAAEKGYVDLIEVLDLAEVKRRKEARENGDIGELLTLGPAWDVIYDVVKQNAKPLSEPDITKLNALLAQVKETGYTYVRASYMWMSRKTYHNSSGSEIGEKTEEIVIPALTYYPERNFLYFPHANVLGKKYSNICFFDGRFYKITKMENLKEKVDKPILQKELDPK